MTLVNRDDAPSVMLIRDLRNGFDVATTTTATQIQFTITGDARLGEFAVIDKGFVGVLPLPDSPTPTVKGASGFELYSLCDLATGSIGVYLEFADFSAALQTLIDSGRKLALFAAVGRYDDASNTIDASLAKAVVY